jgi:hypothetical protein
MGTSRREVAAVAPGGEWMVRAWKWGAGSLSAGAALVSILSSVRSITGAQQVRWIGVAPAADTAFALGDTIQLATTITDGHGGVLPGVSVGWTSTDTSVASVDSAGTVVVRAAGATTIVAAAGGRIAQSRIMVRPRPAAIRVYGDSLVRLPEGGTTRIVARVVDARRHPIPGQSVTWRSADPTVAAIDSLARLTAVTAGRAMVVAASGDLTVELPLEVYPVPATITLLAGDGQHAPAGHRLLSPLRAQIVSRGGRPLAGIAVRVGAPDDTGRAEQATDTSNADGIVQVPWTLGARPGRQRIALGVEGDASIATFVVADADPLAENTRIAIMGTPPSGLAGMALESPLAVRVSDSLGAPLPDLPVAWESDDGGTVVAEGARTDSLGEARARWTLGPRAGAQQAFVQVGSGRAVPRFAVAATALPGAAAALAPVRGTPAQGQVGRPLELQFRVTDGAGNSVPGVALSMRPSAGAVGERTVLSDSIGRATVVWTLGPAAGPQRLTVSARGVERPGELVIQARPGAVSHLALDPLPVSAPAGRPLAPVAVTVTDSFRNPVPNALVLFSTRSGKVWPTRARTDASGRAQVRWTLGAAPGEQQIEASVKEGGRRATGKTRATAPGKRKR